jgi:hypothetical protein
MHSWESAEKRIKELLKGKETFMSLSRELAKKAQSRESATKQPKEYLSGTKGTLTIRNYLGGFYYFTCDELEIHEKEIHLIEGKHSKIANLPSLGDIKDGLLKMALFTNLTNVKIGDVEYNPLPILKLTSRISVKSPSSSQAKMLELLKKEAKVNRFRVLINNKFFV